MFTKFRTIFANVKSQTSDGPPVPESGSESELRKTINKKNQVIDKLRSKIVDDQKKIDGFKAVSARTRQNFLDVRDRNADLRQEVRTLKLSQRSEVRRVGWVTGDPTMDTTGWDEVPPQAPAVLRKRDRLRVLLLNSMGGSMSRYGKALMLHENIEADCIIGAYHPRRHLIYPNEANVFGVFSHDDWKEYIAWAVGHYDVIQSTTMPLSPTIAELYDWLTEKLGRRHIWRETGFVHHYLERPDILPLAAYQEMAGTAKRPGPDRYLGKSFRFEADKIYVDPSVMLYSSPEKGAYFSGKDTHWLPSIRDPEQYLYVPDRVKQASEPVYVYVPIHGASYWKGLHEVMAVLTRMQAAGAPIQPVTPGTARTIFPDLFPSIAPPATEGGAYPIPNHLLSALYQRVDLVIDQIVMGCYGNTGIEAMFSGKPVLGQKRFDEVADAPVIPIDAETLESVLLSLLDDRTDWRRIGAESRDYAMRVHSPQAVARRGAEVIRKVMDESTA